MPFFRIRVDASRNPALPVVRRITRSDLSQSLKLGIDDFFAMPSHAIFLCVIYPLVCTALIATTFNRPLLPLIFPVAAALGLLGPLVATGLYELSRRRESGLDTFWGHSLNVLRSPSLGAIIALGFLLMAIFLIWLSVAWAIYIANFGDASPAAIDQFVDQLFTTSTGWTVIIVIIGAGFVFAALAFTISAISLPLLLDCHVGVAAALLTSIRVVAANPSTMARWGCIVVFLLVIGSIPFFLCLAVVMPVIGHATWHLYRRAVSPNTRPNKDHRPRQRSCRYASDCGSGRTLEAAPVERSELRGHHQQPDRNRTDTGLRALFVPPKILKTPHYRFDRSSVGLPRSCLWPKRPALTTRLSGGRRSHFRRRRTSSTVAERKGRHS